MLSTPLEVCIQPRARWILIDEELPPRHRPYALTFALVTCTSDRKKKTCAVDEQQRMASLGVRGAMAMPFDPRGSAGCVSFRTVPSAGFP